MKNFLNWAFIVVGLGVVLFFATVGAMAFYFTESGVIQCELSKRKTP